MDNILYSELRQNLLVLLVKNQNVKGIKNYQCDKRGFIEVKLQNSYLYITFTKTGLSIIIETPESRVINEAAAYFFNYNFQPTDRIWIKNSIKTDPLENYTDILHFINQPDFKKKYGIPYDSLKARLYFCK